MSNEDNINPLYSIAAQLIASFDDNMLKLASLLRQIQETAPDEFKKLIAIRQLGTRKAYYLVEIDRAFCNLDLPPARLNQIGWTKLSVIAAHVTSENAEQLLGLAETHTVENLKAIMRGEEPIVGGRSVLLLFTGEQYAAFSKAILKHGAVKNGDGFIGKERALIKAVRKNKK